MDRGRQGFTLIDLVITIAVLAIAIPTLLTVAAQLGQRSIRSSTRLQATHAGQALMEDILSLPFDEQANKNSHGNWSATLGPDSATTGRNGATLEQAGVRTTFDDVDDFNGFTESLSGASAGYSRSVTVFYVDPADLNTPLTVPTPLPDQWTPSYKRVVITVTPPVGDPVRFVTIITPVNFL